MGLRRSFWVAELQNTSDTPPSPGTSSIDIIIIKKGVAKEEEFTDCDSRLLEPLFVPTWDLQNSRLGH